MFQRSLTTEEIDEVRLAANKKVQEIFKEANAHPSPARYLRDKFAATINASSLLLDNFDPVLYLERNHQNKDADFLGLMMLGAVKSVEMIRIFENETDWHLSPFSHHDISGWYEHRLIIAEKTFKSNGGYSVCRHLSHTA